MSGHPHAALMILYAQDAVTDAQPWRYWEVLSTAGWSKLEQHPFWNTHNKYRRIGRLLTIKIPESVAKSYVRCVSLGDTATIRDLTQEELNKL